MAMATHPGSREVDVVLRDGSIVHVCSAKSADAPAMTLLLKGLSDRSRWLRFFSAFPDLARAARWATEVDNDRRYGLVATVDGHGQMVGHAGLERAAGRPERAEVALEIADAMQGKGLGTVLLCQLAEAANQLGIQVLDAEVLPENRQMLRVFRDCGYPFKVHSLPGVELVELRTSLPSTGLSLKSRPTRRHERTSWARGQSGTNSAGRSTGAAAPLAPTGGWNSASEWC
jgi:RimJ/RimL family protein N-acetyltransferase